MTLEELRAYLDQAGVPVGSYVIQDLGGGEVEGIGFIDGRWCTYFSERGSYRQVQAYNSEEEAVAAFLTALRLTLRSTGFELS